MKWLTLAQTAFLALGVGLGGASAQEKVVRIASEGAYAPWNFTGADGKLIGFEIDLADELCRRMNAKCELVVQDWDGMIPGLTVKKFDAIMAGMTITEERRQSIAFSRTYAAGPNGFLVSKTSPLAGLPGTGKAFNLNTEKAAAEKAIEADKALLKGVTVGVQGSSNYSNFADMYLKDVADVREYKTTEQHDLDLLAGRIDAVLADVSALAGTLEKPEFKDYVIVGASVTGGVLGEGVGVGLRKEDTDLKTKFDNAIQSAVKDGTVRSLSLKWFRVDIAPKE
jgi:octopine/nopaline transport system substrate-binding protein